MIQTLLNFRIGFDFNVITAVSRIFLNFFDDADQLILNLRVTLTENGQRRKNQDQRAEIYSNKPHS